MYPAISSKVMTAPRGTNARRLDDLLNPADAASGLWNC